MTTFDAVASDFSDFIFSGSVEAVWWLAARLHLVFDCLPIHFYPN